MERVTGRDAIGVRAAYDMGKKKLTDKELAYINRQVASFRNWLMDAQGLTKDEADEACKKIYESELKALDEDDPYHEFIWSRGDQAGDMEVDAALAISNDPEGTADAEFRSYQSYWLGMESAAERGSEGFSQDYWRRSQAKFEQAMDVLTEIRTQYKDSVVPARTKVYLAKIAARLNELRFGISEIHMVKGVKHTKVHGGGELAYRHWAIAVNTLNEIRGNPKRYPVKEIAEKNDDENMEYVDALDHAVYGALAEE